MRLEQFNSKLNDLMHQFIEELNFVPEPLSHSDTSGVAALLTGWLIKVNFALHDVSVGEKTEWTEDDLKYIAAEIAEEVVRQVRAVRGVKDFDAG